MDGSFVNKIVNLQLSGKNRVKIVLRPQPVR